MPRQKQSGSTQGESSFPSLFFFKKYIHEENKKEEASYSKQKKQLPLTSIRKFSRLIINLDYPPSNEGFSILLNPSASQVTRSKKKYIQRRPHPANKAVGYWIVFIFIDLYAIYLYLCFFFAAAAAAAAAAAFIWIGNGHIYRPHQSMFINNSNPNFNGFHPIAIPIHSQPQSPAPAP